MFSQVCLQKRRHKERLALFLVSFCKLDGTEDDLMSDPAALPGAGADQS